jgi:hypothetical protein
VLEAFLSESQITVTAEVFAEKLRQKYPQRASALGDRLIAAFVQDHPQYRVTYDGTKPVSVSWPRKSASTATSPAETASTSTPEPAPAAVAAQPVSGHDDPAVKPVNRRRQPRVPCRKVRAYVITDDVPGVVVDVVDVSRGGLCFVSFEQFLPQTAVSIATHYIEGGQNIFQDGLIVRARPRRSGTMPTEYAVEFSVA